MFSNYNIWYLWLFFFSLLLLQLLITTILLSLTSFSLATRLRGDDESEIAKQQRLFGQLKNWPFPISELFADDQSMNDEEQPEPDSPSPEMLFIDDITLKQRFLR